MASPLKSRKRRGPIAARLLAADAWFDSSLYETGFKSRRFWEAATIFFRRQPETRKRRKKMVA
ncbi:MAG: hypothetical protein E5W53_09700, partial [Mesorhizobium sp.]